jgi:MFS family permease
MAMEKPYQPPPARVSGEPTAASGYAVCVLALLTVANVLNYVDRGIASILAQSIKADLGITDAQLGFLLGTAYSMLYAVVGVAIARVADAVHRARLLAFALGLWSLMTALCGLATGFATLAAARIGVGVGEAAANPCSHSLVADYFPRKDRAVALGVYLLGIYFGGAGALVIGGMILQHWPSLCHLVPLGGACGLPGWKAAFLIVGAPGLLLALAIFTVREPRPRAPQPLAALFGREFSVAIPPFTFIALYRLGGARAVRNNLLLAAGLAVAAALLFKLTHDLMQWAAVAFAAYSICSWGQALNLKDRPLFKMTWGCPTFALQMAAGSILGCLTGTASTWAAPLAIRELHMRPADVGLSLGLTVLVAATLGMMLSGLVTDRWKRRDPRAPIWVGISSILLPTPGLALMLTAHQPAVFIAGYFIVALTGTGWASSFAALTQDLVLPRMRATASAAASLVMAVSASATGPYWAGKISTLTGSLKIGVLSVQALIPVGVILLLITARRLRQETPEARQARAARFGEVAAEG